eukprot:7552645-Pyramimonas_sp.AAC.1
MARACVLNCAASPEVPEYDDWTFDVGYRSPCIPIPQGRSSTQPAMTQGVSTSATLSPQAAFNATGDYRERVSDATEPAWITAESLSQTYPGQKNEATSMNANMLNPNVAQYKWQPTPEDGQAGMRLRKFLDANLAAETGLTHGCSPI